MFGRTCLGALCMVAGLNAAGPAMGQVPNDDITAEMVSCRASSPYKWTGIYLAQGNYFPSPDPSAYACFMTRSECLRWLFEVRERPRGIVFISRCIPRKD